MVQEVAFVEEMQKQRDTLVEGLRQNQQDIPAAKANQIAFDLLEKIRRLRFQQKSHAAAYAVVAYQTCLSGRPITRWNFCAP